MPDAQIEQFKQMAEADPDNELGHFSLGKAYIEAEQWPDAIKSLKRLIELNPNMSKAYELLASAEIQAGDTASAISTLRTGIEIADTRGDRMPRNLMAEMMRELGEEPPASTHASNAPAAGPVGEGQLVCRRCSEQKTPLADRPFKGELGEQVLANICSECWQAWILVGTKVINELRLDFSNPEHSDTYDRYMKEFLNLD